MYNEGERTFYSQKLENCHIKQCWEECKTQSKYEQLVEDVNDFNSKNRWKKRGVAILPTKYGVAFPNTRQEAFLNQVNTCSKTFDPSNAEATYVQNTRMQRLWKTI